MNTYIITGGGRGLGFSIATHLARRPSSEVILAVRDMDQGNQAAAQISGNVSVRLIDMCSAESISRFVEQWDRSLAGLINNAGVQILGPTRLIPG